MNKGAQGDRKLENVETDDDDKAQATNHSRMRLIKKVKDNLDEHVQDQKALSESSFGAVVNMGERCLFSLKIVHFMMLKEVVTNRKKSLWFGVNEKLLRFGIDEFEHITGLICTNVDPYNGSDYTLSEVIGIKQCTVAELEDKYVKEDKKSPNKYKMALLLILEGVLLGKDRSVQVVQLSINILKDVKNFTVYPWGRESYYETVKSLQKVFNKSKTSVGFNLHGFPLAFQIWILESLPDIVSLGWKKEVLDVAPMCLRWISTKKEPTMPQFDDIKKIKLKVVRYVLGDEMKDDHSAHSNESQDDRITDFFTRNRPRVCLLPVGGKNSVQTSDKRKKLKRAASPSESDDFVLPKRSLVKFCIKAKITESSNAEENSPIYDNRPKEGLSTPLLQDCAIEEEDVELDRSKDGDSRYEAN